MFVPFSYYNSHGERELGALLYSSCSGKMQSFALRRCSNIDWREETIPSRYLKEVFSALQEDILPNIPDPGSLPYTKYPELSRGVSHLRTRSNTDHRRNILLDRFRALFRYGGYSL